MPYLSHLEPSASFDRKHFAFASAQGEHAAPHFAMLTLLGLSICTPFPGCLYTHNEKV